MGQTSCILVEFEFKLSSIVTYCFFIYLFTLVVKPPNNCHRGHTGESTCYWCSEHGRTGGKETIKYSFHCHCINGYFQVFEQQRISLIGKRVLRMQSRAQMLVIIFCHFGNGDLRISEYCREINFWAVHFSGICSKLRPQSSLASFIFLDYSKSQNKSSKVSTDSLEKVLIIFFALFSVCVWSCAGPWSELSLACVQQQLFQITLHWRKCQ